MQPVFIVTEVVLLALAVAISWLAARHAERKGLAIVLGTLVAVASFVAAGVLAMAKLNYRLPLVWIAGVAVVVIALAVLIVAFGRAGGWSTKRVAALVGLCALGAMGIFALMYSEPGTAVLRRMYDIRIVQMGEAFGFTPLTPSGTHLLTDQLPVSTLPGPDRGIGLMYSGFELHERKAGAATSAVALRALVAPGARPMSGIDEVIPAEAQVTTLTVSGAPAVAVDFVHQAGAGEAKAQRVTILVTVIDGVDVRFWSNGREALVDGQWRLYPAYSPSGLAKIAETLEPLH